MESKIVHSHEFVRGFATKAIHEGFEVDPSTGAVIAPIHVSSTYEVELDTPPVSALWLFH
jgi:O-acetylhomoserine/O-acetylserine sulfhydrylase-like pyridoxal-dependent enzyme